MQLSSVLNHARQYWRPALIVHLLFTLLGLGLFTPLFGIALQGLLALSGNAAVADQEIALLLLTPLGLGSAIFLVGLLLIVGLFAYLTIQKDRRLAIAEHQRYASDLAATLQPSIQQALRDRKTAELTRFLTQSTRQVRHMRVRWVEFSASTDRTHRR